mgnify:CR=1 FL=1
MIFFFIGLICSFSTILSVYPIFQEPDLGLAMILGCLALAAFFLFCLRADFGKQGQSILMTGLKTFYLSGLVVILESAGIWAYIEIFSRWRVFNILTPIFYYIFKLLGAETALGNGNLHLYGVSSYIFSFSPNAGYLGLIFLLGLGLGTVGLFFVSDNWGKARRVFKISTITLGNYLIIRLVILIAFFGTQEVSEYNDWNYLMLFWHPLFSFFSLLPWLLFMWLFFKDDSFELYNFRMLLNRKSFKEHQLASIVFGCAVFVLLLFIFWLPSGKAKQGRILFEEYYSDWSKSTKPFDQEWYNSASTYNYYTLRTYLSSFYEVTINESPLDQVVLSNYDVILLKIPTKPYSENVIKQLVTFVNRGGGLWVIGDHTNVFGSTTYLNPLLRYFGIKLNQEAVYHNVHGSFNSIYTGPLIKHPILYHVPLFLYATPTSIQVVNPAIRIVDPGLTSKSYAASYTKENFFPDTKPDLNIIFGLNPSIVAGNYGRGRIAVMGDSTPFSNFFMYLPGKTELALSIINWLNHERPPFFLKLLLFLLLVFLIYQFMRLYKRINLKNRALVWPVTFGIVSLIISVSVINYLNKVSCVLPKEKNPLIKVGFPEKFTSIYLPFREWQTDESKNYSTFYIWGQRVGLCNRYYFELDQAISESKALFLLQPKNKFEKNDIAKLDTYLKEGGKVFFFDHGGDGSSSNQFLKKYGIMLEYNQFGHGQISEPVAEISLTNSLPVGTVSGDGDVLLNWISNSNEVKPIFVKKKVGKGELYIFGGVLNFSNQAFGPDGVVPTGERRIINDLILKIYQRAME